MKKLLLFKRLMIIGLIMLFSSGWAFGQVMISQYIETGSGSYPKGIEVCNVSGSTIDFSVTNLTIFKGTNGATPALDFTVNTGTLAAGDIIVIGTAQDVSTATGFRDYVEATGTVFYTKTFTFNGDDALELYLDDIIADVFGTAESDPGTGWVGNGVQTYNQNISIKSGIVTGDTDGWADPSERFEVTTTDNSLTGFGIAPIISSGTPTLTITGPNGGDIAYAGQTYDVEWTSSDYTGTVDIEYFDGSTYTTMGDDEIDDGSFTYTIPSDITPGTTYKVRISDDMTNVTVFDESDADFEIKGSIFVYGDLNDAGGTWNPLVMTIQEDLGTHTWKYTYQENNRTAITFLYRPTTANWDNKWSRGDVVSLNSLTDWWNNGGDGTLTATIGKYYTYIFKDVSLGTDGEGYVFETSAAPVTLNAVSQLPTIITPTDAVTVTVTASADPSVEEFVYVRYTSDNWATSSFEAVTFTPTTATGTATIPAQVHGTTVYYYVLSTCVADISTVANTDLATINYNFNNGSNYTYTSLEASTVIINEVDADTDGTDVLEFIELYDGGAGNTALDGLVVVLFNGSDDQSYEPVFDLDGFATDANGYFVIGNTGVSNVDLVASNGFLQNGADAVALFYGDDTDFPNDTPLTTANLIDAFIYDTSDGDDAGLLPLLYPGQAQINEAGNGNSARHSNQRLPNGSGGARNTLTYGQYFPTPGAENDDWQTTWTGAINTDWATAGNWTDGLPTANHDVTVPTGLINYPVISAFTSANCYNLTLVSPATLNIVSDPVNSGSLIFGGVYTGSPTAVIYQRFMEVDQWHMLGSPLIGQIIDGPFLTFNAINGMKDYLEGIDDWSPDYFVVPTPPMPFSLGKGYATKRFGPGAVSLIGTPNNAAVDIALVRANYGWNLLSNPFTSAIAATVTGDAVNNLLTVNELVMEPSFVALYVWDQISASYKIINNSGGTLDQDYLQVGQGFFVKSADPAAGVFSMTPAMQSHQTAIAFKASAENTWASITLNAEVNNVNASTQISYQADMSRGLDIGYDAGLFSSNPEFELYTRLVEDNGVDFGIQCLPTNYEDLIVPIGLKAKAGEIVTFSASALDIPEEYAVVIEDRTLDVFTDLSEIDSDYSIQLSVDSDGTGRFFVHTTFKSTLGLGDIDTQAFHVFTRVNDNQLVIRGETTANTTARVYSITGKLIADVSLKQALENRVSFTADAGIYIVQISNEQGTYTQKFSWVK